MVMTAEEAAGIMMSGGGKSAVIQPLTITENGTYTAPKGIDGYSPLNITVLSGTDSIWTLFKNAEPLIVITIAPYVVYFVYDIGDTYGTYMAKSTHDGANYISNVGYRNTLFGVIAHNNKNVYYHQIAGTWGTRAENHFEYVNDALYQTFRRDTKIAAINASNLKLSISSNAATFSGLLKWYQDDLNFSQYDYSDGSHWEERYAWSSSYSGFSSGFNLTFSKNGEVGYTEQIRGSNITEKYTNWSGVCDSVLSAPSGIFPRLEYTKPEDHFDEELYLNDDAKNRGYYDNNVSYMAKWKLPTLWE